MSVIDKQAGPVRGSLRLTVSASNSQVTAGTDFSIFVLIQNPFDVAITIYNAQTHIPVELIDVNALRLELVREEAEVQPWYRRLLRMLLRSISVASRWRHGGIATAVGTSFNPGSQKEFVQLQASIDHMEANSSFVGVQFSFPENPSAEDLDRIFRRIDDHRKGLTPVTLQPGDSIVKQFVLRTRRWLLFTPLSHVFQIQVDYSADGADHAQTVAHEQSIRSTLGAMAIGAAIGAIFGVLLKNLTSAGSGVDTLALLRAALAAVVGSVAVVVAFSRKASAQPIVSVEDFWGGALIGFTAGFFGFERFVGVFSPPDLRTGAG